jgi:ABC-type transport system involved in multi-copper enzyme maturation permease subunit
MMALLATELARMYLRRMARALLLLAVAGIVIAALWISFVSDPSDASARFDYRFLDEILFGLSTLLTILALILGASFIGADWQKGVITTTLTWEPRRVRLLGAKVLACAIAGVAAVLAIQLLLALAMWPVAALRGSMSGVDVDWLRSTGGLMLRIAALGGFTAVLGFALASIGRNTALAIGVNFAYFAVVENLIRGFKPAWRPYLLGDNTAQLLTNQAVIRADHSLLDAVLVLALYAFLLVGAATVLFVRRDVT